MKLLTWMSGDGNAVVASTRLTVAGSALVIVAAGILGFTALHDLFLAINLFSPWLGFLFPLLFDFSELTAAVAVLNAKLQGEEDTFAWRMVLLFTGLGILANIAHALYAGYIGEIEPAQAVMAVFFTSLFPLSIALVTHILKRTITRQIERQQAVATLAAMAEQVTVCRQELATLQEQMTATRQEGQDHAQALATELEQLRHQRATLSAEIADLERQKRRATMPKAIGKAGAPAQVGEDKIAAARQILAEWVTHGIKVNGSELGRQLGIAERTGRQLAKDLLPEVERDLAETPAAPIGSNGTSNGWTRG